MAVFNFYDFLLLSSVQLVQLGSNNQPIGIASGALVDYSGRRILLTVEHAVGNQGQWAIQINYEPKKGTKLYKIGPMNFLKKGSLGVESFKNVDFAYAEIPPDITLFRQAIDPSSLSIKSEKEIIVHKASLKEIPFDSDDYGFCGMVLPELEPHYSQIFFTGELRVYSSLKYLRYEDGFYFFSLPYPHPGHQYFKGCSGAPVLSHEGKLIGLVCGGDISMNEIRVIPVSKYKTAIDISISMAD